MSTSALAALPKPTEQESQENEDNTHEQRESQVESHDQPLHSGGQWADHTACGANLN